MSGDAAATPRRFPWAIYWVLFALIGVLAVLPVVTTVVSAAIANAYGCTISESVRAPCVINGQDWGEWLQFGGISVFYIFLTFPIGVVLFLVWLVVLLVHRSGFSKRSRTATQNQRADVP